jgi:hypothetical protein
MNGSYVYMCCTMHNVAYFPMYISSSLHWDMYTFVQIPIRPHHFLLNCKVITQKVQYGGKGGGQVIEPESIYFWSSHCPSTDKLHPVFFLSKKCI